ncbi:methyltransferase domain-containing protein [Alkalibacillus salilacus]|uniref:23S rRNA (Guanine745-N1)-methyltransferase n=1 Tax=Alkalibacillus salilacus TaxID=284582 RepID=A0ABT9VB18_9BACI|nr:methyltransferase domain-containing protein [Alkalibacillus salilacus]MDQ0158138.1 23S rRNA (guanine745-N1)-methyltransferase [Alkalibacillus salilacus]
MGKLSKKQRAAERLQKNITALRCPICHETVTLKDYQNIICPNRHVFDLAKQGYLNMAKHSQSTIYDTSLFSARQRLNEAGFYQPLVNQLDQELADLAPKIVLDAGCGEGSHLQQLNKQQNTPFPIGIDLAKEGIQQAAKHDEDVQWIVADLANMPLTNQSVDVLFNILSPSNYAEFERVLAEDGFVIKVVPNQAYLKEIRQQLDQTDYSNTDVVNRFGEAFDIIREHRVFAHQALTEAMFQDLIHMTPLTQDADINKLQYVQHVTLDLTVLVGQKRS